jgi:hypothetical protein
LLKSFEFIPGIKWFESEMHNTLFQHSVFGAIVFLIVSNTGVYKFVKDTIFQCCGVKLDGNTLQLVHAVVFMVIMYFGSMYLFAPLLGEGNDPEELPYIPPVPSFGRRTPPQNPGRDGGFAGGDPFAAGHGGGHGAGAGAGDERGVPGSGGARENQAFEQGGVTALLDRLRIEGGAPMSELCSMDPEAFVGDERALARLLCAPSDAANAAP